MSRFGRPPDDESQPSGLDLALLRRLWPFVRPYRRAFALALLILIASFGIELLGPYLIQQMVDGPVTEAMAGGDVEPSNVLWLGGIYLASILVGLGLAYAYAMLTARNGQRVIVGIRIRLFEHILHLSPTWHDENAPGRLTTRITSDVENLNELIATGVLQSLFDLLKIVGILIALFVIDPSLALYTLLVTPVVIVMSLAFRRRARDAYRDVRGRLARQNGFTAELVDGIATVRAFSQEDTVQEQYAELNAQTRSAWVRTVLAFSLFFALVDLALRWGQGGLLLFGGYQILDGAVTLGVFFQFWLLYGKLTTPIRELGEKYNVLQSALSSCERIFAILDEPRCPTEPDPDTLTPLPDGAATLRFERVQFGYDPEHRVLHDIDVEIRAGTTCAIVGPTGAGKSTLVALVSRLHDPQGGQVTWNGTPIRRFDLTALRRRIAVVPQDVFLFSGSVLDNVRLFDAEITRERVCEALRTVGALDFVDVLPNGLDTELDERGATLSQGERQLLSFARAIVREPDVLVLDEATANIDSRSEATIQTALSSLLENRTCIVVAHRLSTVRGADQIVVLQDGRVAESGDHRHLLERDGTYARMLRSVV